jgi:tetratricopeptide (TPR) repeat protein
MLMISELGVVGLLLFGTFIVSSGIAAIRARRLGPSAAALVAGSLGAGAYWLVHASYDWFWHYPAVTAPVMFLLGAAVAPPLLDRAARLSGRARLAALPFLVLPLIVAVPLFLSQRYANRAYGEAQDDPSAALSDLDRAADLDPYDPEPLLAKGLIESRLGNSQEAVSALRDAIDRQSDSYAAHFFLAKELAATDPAAARVEAREALRLNPLDLQTRALNRRLQRARQL